MRARPLESTFQRKVVKQLKTLKNTWFYKAADRNRVGVPDLIVCVDGQFVGLELKRDSKAVATAIQLHVLLQIQLAGGTGKVVSPENWDETWRMLLDMAGGTK